LPGLRGMHCNHLCGALRASSLYRVRLCSKADTTTPAGKAMFQMLGVFAEFERSIIQERVRAGLQRAKREGKRLGRPPIADKLAERIRAVLAGGMSARKTAAKFDVNPSTVQRVAHPFEGADNCRRGLGK